jgi:hypothetical protein
VTSNGETSHVYISFGEPPIIVPPTVVTVGATEVTQASATLNATVNPNGHNVSDCHFEYGTSEAYGSTAPCTPLPGSGSSPVAVSASVTGLTANATYHFRISATNVSGTHTGSDLTFTPPAGKSHYYVNGPLAGSEPTAVIEWGTLALKTVVGGSGEVVCHTAEAGIIDNPSGGGPGVGSIQGSTIYACESTTCPSTSVVTAESLPWASVLEAAGSVITSKTTVVKIKADCQKEGKSVGSETFVGADQPTFFHGTSALHPGFLQFALGSSSLEKEGSKGAVQAEIEGDLKLFGYDSQELINVKNP